MRLHEDVRLLVVFLGFRTTDAAGVSVPKYGGTGFFVTHPVAPEMPRLRISYLITARHVAEALAGPFIIGINDATGVSHIIDIDQANWSYHPDPNVDVAAVNFELNDDAWVVFTSENFIDESQLFKQFGVGDLVYIVGLYRLFPGDAKISPIVHTGHIAMAPNDEIPAQNRTSGKIVGTRGYLIEAQTLEGLSGSPVFIRRTNVTGLSAGAGRVVAYSDHVYLLGLWQGAWDGIAGDILSEQTGKGVRVPVGMGITVPAQRIMEVLKLPVLEQARVDWLTRQREMNAAIMDQSAQDNSAF